MKNFLHKFISLLGASRYYILFIIIIGLGGYGYYSLSKNSLDQKNNFTKAINDLSSKFNELANRFSALSDQSNNLNTALQDNTNSVQEKVDKINSTVGTLDRLSKTDPQLLQKYSKVFFLNENYVPSKLINIDEKYVYGENRILQFHALAYPYLQKMLEASKSEGLNLLAISSYRSFGTQAILKSGYKVTYGAGTANKFSADQGYSEHQLGTTLDLTTPTVADTFSRFDSTAEYTWLVNNAYKYGFILSYPANNKYYIYEPWHWRFVGIDLATRLHTDGKYFYDLDQRTIDGYLFIIFD